MLNMPLNSTIATPISNIGIQSSQNTNHSPPSLSLQAAAAYVTASPKTRNRTLEVVCLRACCALVSSHRVPHWNRKSCRSKRGKPRAYYIFSCPIIMTFTACSIPLQDGSQRRTWKQN